MMIMNVVVIVINRMRYLPAMSGVDDIERSHREVKHNKVDRLRTDGRPASWMASMDGRLVSTTTSSYRSSAMIIA